MFTFSNKLCSGTAWVEESTLEGTGFLPTPRPRAGRRGRGGGGVQGPDAGGGRARRGDVTGRRAAVVVVLGKSRRDRCAWRCPTSAPGDTPSLPKAQPELRCGGAGVSEAIVIQSESWRKDARRERRGALRGRQAPARELRNPAGHHEVPV